MGDEKVLQLWDRIGVESREGDRNDLQDTLVLIVFEQPMNIGMCVVHVEEDLVGP